MAGTAMPRKLASRTLDTCAEYCLGKYEERSIFINSESTSICAILDHTHDEITNDKSQTYWRSKTTGGQAFYYERLSPEESRISHG